MAVMLLILALDSATDAPAGRRELICEVDREDVWIPLPSRIGTGSTFHVSQLKSPRHSCGLGSQNVGHGGHSAGRVHGTIKGGEEIEIFIGMLLLNKLVQRIGGGRH